MPGSEPSTGMLQQAWSLNDARLKGESVSRWCREPRHLSYGNACRLGAQLKRLYSHVPRQRVHTVLLDDVKANPRAAYLSVLQFLGVDDDGRSDFGVSNPAKERRSIPCELCSKLNIMAH